MITPVCNCEFLKCNNVTNPNSIYTGCQSNGVVLPLWYDTKAESSYIIYSTILGEIFYFFVKKGTLNLCGYTFRITEIQGSSLNQT